MDAKLTGQLIAARRKELELSQTELAERLHVTDKAISRWETGRGMPSVDSLEPLAEALGLSVSEVLGGRRLLLEEQTKAAEAQALESMRKNRRMVWKGALLALLMVTLLLTGYLGWHYVTAVDGQDYEALAEEAGAYLTHWKRPVKLDKETLRVVQTEQRGDYMAALLTDDEHNWGMCVYDRDDVFKDRWRSSGGITGMTAGDLRSWNVKMRGDVIIIFCGGNLPTEAAYYTFENSGITYTCPIKDRRVLDIFLLPDTLDISSTWETLLTADKQPLENR